MNTLYLTRQLDILPEEVLGKKITIIGAGAIGSFVTLSLAKMGFSNITVYDADDVSSENMNCQFYPINDIGQSKVDSLSRLVWDFTGIKLKVKDEYYHPNDHGFIRSDIVISAVDSMAARAMIFKNTMAAHFLDGRMGAEYIQTYHVNMEDSEHRENYEKSLYSDEEAVQERCTAKATMYTVNLVSGLIAKAVKDIVTDNINPIDSLDWDVSKNSAVWFTNGTKLTM